MCNDDWNIDHRRWSEKMSSLGGPTLKKKKKKKKKKLEGGDFNFHQLGF